MSALRKNVASQHIGFVLTNSSTGAPVTAGGAGNVVIDGGAQAACAGTFTHKGGGQWDYAPTQGETNGNSICFAFTGTGALQVGMQFFTIGYDPSAAQVPANVTQINGDATSASNLERTTENIGRGTCTTGGTTTSIPTSAFSPGGAGIVSGQFIGRTIIFDGDTTTAALRGQASNITANTSGATPTFTVSAMTTAPASGDTFSVV